MRYELASKILLPIPTTIIAGKNYIEMFRTVRMIINSKFLAISLLLWIPKIETQTTTPVIPSISTAPNFAPPLSTSPPQCQDDLDAQVIVDSHMKEEIIAGILAYRERNHCIAINQIITEKNGGKYFIADDYIYTPVPEGENPPFKDLCFGLVKDEGIVMSGYLNIFFEHRDETWIIIALVLTTNMEYLKATYDIYHEGNFEHMITKQRSPFRNMLKKWCAQSREPEEPGDLDHNSVLKDAQALTNEEYLDGWTKTRNQIETILMKKSIKYAKAVIAEFENANQGKPIEDIINENSQTYILNHDLADAYSSLARYIKNKYKYIANIMYGYSDGNDRWAAWIMCISVLEPSEWARVSQEFQKLYHGESLSKLILRKNTQDKVMAEMMAAVVDPTFTPTTFTPKLAPGCSGLPTIAATAPPPTGPATLPNSPPPVTPTTVLPTPSAALPASVAPASAIPTPPPITPAPILTPTPPTSAPTASDSGLQAATPMPFV